MRFDIFDNNDNLLTSVASIEYSGSDMGACSITTTINSPAPLPLVHGCYILYRGEKYTLQNDATKKKQARIGSAGDAFVYENIVFDSVQADLVRCPMRDLVIADNGIHNCLPNFTFYDDGSLTQVRDRVQANLDEYYGIGVWQVVLPSGILNRNNEPIEDYEYSVNDSSVWDFLANAAQSQNFVFTRRNKVITLGRQEELTSFQFRYGKDNGLISLAAQTEQNEQVISRLYAYGTTQNMPYRYYNRWRNGAPQYPVNSSINSLYVPNLMLPGFTEVAANAGNVEYRYFTENGTEVTNATAIANEEWDYRYVRKFKTSEGVHYCYDVYLESRRALKKLGTQHGFVTFDGSTSETKQVYPSLQWLNVLIKSTDTTNDNGIPDKDGGIDVLDFEIVIDYPGFLLTDDGIGAGETPVITLTSGMCNSRQFEVIEMFPMDANRNVITDISETADRSRWKFAKLRCARFLDNSISQYFPNKNYHIQSGDKFTFENIYMPEAYITAASEELLQRSIKYLKNHDTATITLVPEIDNVRLAKLVQHDEALRNAIKEGMRIIIQDDDLDTSSPAGGITISQLNIREGESDVPEFQITLSNEKSADMIQRVASEVTRSLKANGGLINAAEIARIANDAGEKRFVSKKHDDTAEGEITFNREIHNPNKKWQIKANGDAKFQDTEAGNISTDTMKSKDFIPNGLSGTGFGMYRDSGGKAVLEADIVAVRQKLSVNELEVRKWSAVGGNLAIADKSTIIKVEAVTGGYKCYFKVDDGTDHTTNNWKRGWQALSESWGNTLTHYYWRVVTEVGSDYIILSDDSRYKDADSDAPQAGDVIIHCGMNSTYCAANNIDWEASGSNFMALSTTDTSGGSIMAYHNINDFSFNGKEVFVASPDLYLVDSKIQQIKTRGGDTVPMSVDMGVWASGTTAHYYEKWSYQGSVWLCVNQSAGGITTAPVEGADWIKVVSKGEQGIQGASTANVEWYQLNNSNATAPSIPATPNDTNLANAGWSKQLPTATQQRPYCWKLVQTVSNNNDTATYTAGNAQIAYGWVNAFDHEERWYLAKDSDTAPLEADAGWKSSIAATTFDTVATDKYLWTKVMTYYTNAPATLRIYLMSMHAHDGSSVNILGTKHNTSELPTTGNTNGDGYIINGDLWVYNSNTESDTTHVRGFENVGRIKGEKGDPGDDLTVSDTVVKYSTVHTATQPADSTFDKDTIAATNPQKGDYVWSRTYLIFGDGGTSLPTYSCSYFGSDGTDGLSSFIVDTFTEQWGLSTDRNTQPASWSTSVLNVDATNRYLWRRSNKTFKCIDERGRNLLELTNQGKTGWEWGMSSAQMTVTPTTLNGGNGVKFITPPSSSSWAFMNFHGRNNLNAKLQPNTRYVISFDCISSIARSIYVSVIENDTHGFLGESSRQSILANTITHVVLSLTTVADGAVWTNSTTQGIYLPGNFLVVGEFTISNLKLELGSTATPYTPAPEDMTETEAAHIIAVYGDKGDNAVQIELTPDALTFDTEDNGLVASAQTTTIKVLQGGEDITSR
nr:hypothetical protein [Prevotella sp.]